METQLEAEWINCVNRSLWAEPTQIDEVNIKPWSHSSHCGKMLIWLWCLKQAV